MGKIFKETYTVEVEYKNVKKNFDKLFSKRATVISYKAKLNETDIVDVKVVRSEASKNSSEIYYFIKKILIDKGWKFIKGYNFINKEFSLVNKGQESRSLAFRMQGVSTLIKFGDDYNRITYRFWNIKLSIWNHHELFLSSPSFKDEFIKIIEKEYNDKNPACDISQ